jgi:Fic family protein
MPPKFEDLLKEVIRAERYHEIVSEGIGPFSDGKYLHWDKLRYYDPPGDLSREEWWLGTKWARKSLYKPVPLKDKHQQPFQYLEGGPTQEHLHHIDLQAGGKIEAPRQITDEESRDRYYIRSLIEEATTSSQLEGAHTTRQEAKEMILNNREPRDTSEQMVLNNFRTMRYIRRKKNEPLSQKMVFDIHKMVTEKTLDKNDAAGRFRNASEKIYVADENDNIFFFPPDSAELEGRLKAMCSFANGNSDSTFLHPVLRGIILHFWLAFDHPFVDGNGRTARALFYWSMLHEGYWLFEFISISRILLNQPSQYSRAFLHTESDDNDLTYFILYHLEVIRKAIAQLHEYIGNESKRITAMERELRQLKYINHRQRALISHALRHPYHQYTIKSHQTSHNIVYQTARVDLMALEKEGILEGEKIGRTMHYTPTKNLREKLSRERNSGLELL